MEQCPSVLQDHRLKARHFVPGCRVILLWDTSESALVDQRWANVLLASLGIKEPSAFFFTSSCVKMLGFSIGKKSVKD